MSIASTTNRVSYTGNGAVDTYDYTFRIFSQSDLLVVVKETSTSIETTLIISTDYTVTNVGELSGGTIVLVNSSQDWLDAGGELSTGYTLTIRRAVSLTQTTDIRNQGDFFPEAHEDTFDYGRMIDQQQQDEIDRSIKLPESVLSSNFDTILPTDIETADVVIITNPTGDGFVVGPTATEISGANASAIAAAASETAAGVSETNAAASETAAGLSETAAGVSETNAAASETAAGLSETAAGVSETNAAASETAAGVSETNAAASETAAGVSETNAAASETAAGVSETNAAASETAAGVSETNAGASAAAAAAAVNSAFFRDVVYVTNASSPIAIVDGDNGKLYSVDSSGGAVVFNLPGIASLASLPFNLAVSLGTSGNDVTINRGSTDTIEGATSVVLSAVGTGLQMAADTDNTPDNWTTLNFGSVVDSSITQAKLSDTAVDLVLQENFIDNPEGSIYQRVEDPTALTSWNDAEYSVDRWRTLHSADLTEVSRVTDAPDGAMYAMKISKNTGAGYFGMSQVKKSTDVIPLRGETLNFTIAAKTESSEVASIKIAVLEWTGTADTVTDDPVTTWAATPTWAASFTELSISSSLSLTDSYQDFNLSVTVGGSSNNLVFVIFTDNSESINDSLFLSAARAYKSDSQMPYVRRDDICENERCLSYYWRIIGPEYFANGYFYDTTSVMGVIKYPVPMWRIPTPGSSDSSSGLYNRPTSSSGTTSALSYSDTNKNSTSYDWTAASSSTSGFGTEIGAATSKYIDFSSEI